MRITVTKRKLRVLIFLLISFNSCKTLSISGVLDK